VSLDHEYALIAVPRPWVKPWLWSWAGIEREIEEWCNANPIKDQQ
jgi:hypothetical protein